VSSDDYILRDLRVGQRREAELLADMWNRSDQAWPGGWTGGVPLTAERILRDEMTQDCYGRWVVEHKGEIIGFISLLADPKQAERASVGLLNARPDHHGKGVGKRLLRTAIDAAIEGGFDEVELYTWPGNLKAVPLYKKMGFFWLPETSVEMQNFIPSIIRMPLLADFFQDRDWYQIQQRDLTVAEDVERWHGVRVFRYRFVADGRSIEVVVDRLARMTTAVETDKLYVAAWVGEEHLPALQEQTLHYEFRAKADAPVAVSLLADGESGVPVSTQDSFEVSGRHTVEVPFRLPADLERKKPGEPPHRILSTVTVDGVSLKLGTAVHMRDPVEIGSSTWGLPVGKRTAVRVKLRNRLPFPAGGSVWISSPPELQRSDERLSFRMSRGGWTDVSLSLEASRRGTFPLEAQVEFSQDSAGRLASGQTPPHAPRGRRHTLWVRAFSPGAFAVSDDKWERRVTAESDRLLVQFWRVGGRMEFRDKVLGRGLFNVYMPEIGPPFGTFSPLPRVYDTEVENLGGSVHLVTHSRPDRWPGLTLERTAVISPGVLELRHRLLNAANRARKVQVRVRSYGYLGAGKLTLPDADGLIQHERTGWGDWPGWSEIERRSAEFPESWVAAEEDGAVVGTVWQGDGLVSPDHGGGARMTYDAVTVPPGGAVQLPVMWLVAGAGDYRTVRSVWASRLRQEPLLTARERRPDLRDVLRGGLHKKPMLMTRASHRTRVELVSERKRELSGEAHLSLPRGVQLRDGARQMRFQVAGLRKGKPARRNLSIKASADCPTAGVGELRLSAKRREHVFPVPVVILRKRGEKLKLRHDDDTVTVDNGWLRFKVSAQHAGSIVSLQREDRDLLTSSYPNPRAYHWMNPWYGGIRAGAGSDWDRRFRQVRSRIESVDVEGQEGIRWRGAAVAVTALHEDLKWLRYEAQYLTTAGSNLIAVLVKARNRSTAAMGVNLNVTVWPQADMQPAHADAEGEPLSFRPDDYEYAVRSGKWLAFGHPRGPVLAAVATERDPRARFHLENMGDGQFSASFGHWASFNHKVRTVDTLVWLVVCRSLEEARAYRYFSELRTLP